MDFNYRPTNRLMSPAEVLAERQALQAGQQKNALLQFQLQNAQAEAQQRNALMQQQAQQAQSRSGYLNDLAGNMGPPQEFSPARALAAGLKADEIKLMQGPEQKLMNVAPGGAIFDPRSGRSVFTAPFKPETPKEDEFVARMRAGGIDPASPQGQALIQQRLRKEATHAPAVQVNTGDRVPTGVLKQQDELIDRMSTAKAIRADLGAIRTKIESGQLDFGPVRNLVNQGRNIAGMSSPESRNFASFKSSLEKLRNDSLRLNSGVQTEGDAQRAWNELFQSINDRDLVLQRLQEIEAINARAEQLQRFRLDVIRDNFGARGLPEPPVQPAVGAGSAPAAPTSQVRRYNPATGKIE